MNRNRLFIWIGSSLFIGMACLLLIYNQLASEGSIRVYDRPGQGIPQIGGNFNLTDQNGMKRSTAEFHGKLQLIYFGYSFCPDICPLGLQNMSGALNVLGYDVDEIAPIFVTVDPERDTVENMKIYASNFHPKFIMLTGAPAEIATVLKMYKVYAAKAKPDGTMADYLMDHSTLIYLLDRQGQFIKSFPHTISPDELAKAITHILVQEKERH
jgi:cytochrome oxidase Cu insertion factor (SCO1/SenC/PrrC family)